MELSAADADPGSAVQPAAAQAARKLTPAAPSLAPSATAGDGNDKATDDEATTTAAEAGTSAPHAAAAASTAAAAVARPAPRMTPLQWLRQTYEQQWKGTVTISTIAADDHAPKTPHWLCCITASGAVVQDKTGRNVTLEPVEVDTEGRSKKEAEQTAAQQIYDMMVQQGWYDPNKPPVSKKGQVGRATKFITDSTPSNEANPLAYLDISIDGTLTGRVVIELFRYKTGTTLEEHAPLAVENFLALCRGVDIAGRHLSYAGVPFTRIVPRFLMQAGDVLNKDGSGGAHIHSSYGEHYPDEGLDDRNYRHNKPFMLSVANMGIEDSNSSQFFITLAPTHELDGRHTCFGKLLAGYGVLKQVEALSDPTDSDSPPNRVLIQSCGELPAGFDYASCEVPIAAGWPLFPEDQGPPPDGVRETQFRLDVAAQLKEAGNTAYKQADAAAALARYEQAFRYLNWTTFKIRTPSGDADLEPHESRALWDMEVLLMNNIAAAHLKMGQYRAAAAATEELLHRAPDNVKGLLRAAQAYMGVGWSEFDTAAGFLRRAFDQAQQQQLPRRDIVAAMHRLRGLQQQHSSLQKAKFSAAFRRGLLHHPADDIPTCTTTVAAAPAAAAASSSSSNAIATNGIQHRIADALLGRRVVGGISKERVLDSEQPVLIDDVWGTHPLVADEELDRDTEDDNYDTLETSVYYSRGMTERLVQLGVQVGGLSAAADDDDNGHVQACSSRESLQDTGDNDEDQVDWMENEMGPGMTGQGHVSVQLTSSNHAAGVHSLKQLHLGDGTGPQLAVSSSNLQQQQQQCEVLPDTAAAVSGIATAAGCWQHEPAQSSNGSTASHDHPAGGLPGYGVGAMRALPHHGIGHKAKARVP